MQRYRHQYVVCPLLLAAWIAISTVGWSIPVKIAITGKLLDEAGEPFTFFDDSECATAIVEFSATGGGDVVVEFLPSESSSGDPETGKVALNGFALQSPPNAPTFELKVDLGATDQVVAQGYVGLSSTPDITAEPIVWSDVGGSGVDLQLETTSGGQDLKFENQIFGNRRGSLLCGDLAMPATTASGLRLTLQNLPAGDYRLTSYHNDTFVQREALDVVVDGELVLQNEDQSRSQPVSSPILDVEVSFFDSEASTEVLHTVQAQTQVFSDAGGIFSIPTILTDELLVLDELWYSLAIDADGDGLDEGDLFVERFEILSVPFALSAQPVTYFSTHNGYLSTSSGTSVNFNWPETSRIMVVAPFNTPPGGVRFNKMYVFVASVPAGRTFSFGIYDAAGALVATSGKIETSVEIKEAFLEVEIEPVDLLPSSLYFTAITANSASWFMLRNILVPSIPLSGAVPLESNSGILPESFVIGDIEPNPESVPISIAMILDESGGQSKTKAEELPKVRWIFTNRQ